MRVLACTLLALPALARAFYGVVVSVHDGDTLTVMAEDRTLQVRIAEIDAPDLRQAFGERARDSLAQMCLGKQAEVSLVGPQRSAAAARVLCEGVDAGAQQVERGLAWVSRRRGATASPLFLLEDQAQRSREGLWVDKAPAPPWAYRANRRNRL